MPNPGPTSNNGALVVVMGVVVAFLVVLAIVTSDRGQTTLTEAEYHGKLIADGMRGIKCYLGFREANPDVVSSVGTEQLDKCFAAFDKLANNGR